MINNLMCIKDQPLSQYFLSQYLNEIFMALENDGNLDVFLSYNEKPFLTKLSYYESVRQKNYIYIKNFTEFMKKNFDNLNNKILIEEFYDHIGNLNEMANQIKIIMEQKNFPYNQKFLKRMC